jgi:phosphoserine phosphatase RsbU/P
MKIRKLSFNLSAYLIISEILLAGIIIIVGYLFARNLMRENFLYRIRYYSEEAISPIKNSMIETKGLIDNFTTEFEKKNFLKYPEIYAKLALKARPGIIEIRIATADRKDFTKFITDRFFYHDGDSIKEDKAGILNEYSKAESWMSEVYKSGSSGWSSPFYSENKVDGNFKQILIYARPFTYTSGLNITKAVVYCAISIDNEMKSLQGLNKIVSGEAILLSDKGVVIYPPKKDKTSELQTDLYNFIHKNIDIQKVLKQKSEGSVFVNPDSLVRKKSIAIYWPVSSINWMMVAVFPEMRYMAELNRIVWIMVLVILFMGSISAAVAVYLSMKLVSPISVLAKDSRRIIEEEEGIQGDDWITEAETLSRSIEIMKRKLIIYENDKLKTESDNAEMERELNLARDIEMGIIPTKFPLFPDRTDFDCYGKLIPAKIVGGDLFDFFLLDDNNLFVSICDTLGKGIPAAMFAVATRTLIRNIANPITRVGKIMELLNDELSIGQDSDMFVTVIMGKLNLATGEFAYCNAGHPRPIIMKKDSQVFELEAIHGFPIGVKKNQPFSETTVALSSGESIVAYTDGVTEEVDKFGAFYGKEKLLSVLQAQNSASPEKIVKEVFKSLERFRGKSEIYDDTTILAIKYLGKTNITGIQVE